MELAFARRADVISRGVIKQVRNIGDRGNYFALIVLSPPNIQAVFAAVSRRISGKMDAAGRAALERRPFIGWNEHIVSEWRKAARDCLHALPGSHWRVADVRRVLEPINGALVGKLEPLVRAEVEHGLVTLRASSVDEFAEGRAFDRSGFRRPDAFDTAHLRETEAPVPRRADPLPPPLSYFTSGQARRDMRPAPSLPM